MANPPSYQKDAVMTPRGWIHPKSGELLASRKFTQEDIDKYYGIASKPTPIVEPVAEEVEEVQVLTEAPVNKSLDDMTKSELEALGQQHGIDLDKREKKSTLVEKMIGILKD